MTERRFNEAEVAAIFERAAETQHSTPPQLAAGEGMTLAELEGIGREIGISAEVVRQAANSLDRPVKATRRRFLGLPVGVGRTIELGRKLTDDEWDQFVVDLRETFDAKGRLTQEGSFRQWTNGNLQALLEPTGNGHRIRLRTIKGDARGLMVGGLSVAGVGLTAITAAAIQGAGGDVGMISSFGVLVSMGAAMFGAGAIRLPGWARVRERQMEQLAARVTALDARPAGDKLLSQGSDS